MRNPTLSNPVNQPTSSKQVGYRVNDGRFQCTNCVVDKYEAPEQRDPDGFTLINDEGDRFVPMLVADLDGQGCLECGAFGLAALIDVVRAMLDQALDPNAGDGSQHLDGGIELDTAAKAAALIGVEA